MKAIAIGTKPGAGRCKAALDGVNVELYDSGRYFTVTGHVLDGIPEPLERQSAIARLYARLTANGGGTAKAWTGEGLPPGAEVILQAFKDRGWYHGEIEPGKHSVTCPWKEESHQSADDERKTVIFTDREVPGFDCRSRGCREYSIAEVRRKLGIAGDVRAAQVAAAIADEEEDLGRERYTDTNNARALVTETAGNVLHAEEMGEKFFVYDGQMWEAGAKKRLRRYVDRVCRRLFGEANMLRAEAEQVKEALGAKDITKEAQDKLDERVKVLLAQADLREGGAMRLESYDGGVKALNVLKSYVSVKMEEFDAHPTWLNCQNGTLDLGSGEFWDHRPADLLTKLAGADYDSEATAPMWERFLACGGRLEAADQRGRLGLVSRPTLLSFR